MNKKFKTCRKCQKKILKESIHCTHCGEKYTIYPKGTKSNESLPLLKSSSLYVIKMVAIFTFIMIGIISFFEMIGEFFKF